MWSNWNAQLINIWIFNYIWRILTVSKQNIEMHSESASEPTSKNIIAEKMLEIVSKYLKIQGL